MTADITTALTADSQLLLQSLRKHAEYTQQDASGSEWGMTYLDNAIPTGWSRHKFAGHLSDLAAKGLYKDTSDDAWGKVASA